MTNETLMTFKVRGGLSVHVERTNARGEKTITPFGTAFRKECVELYPSEVKLHAHALESTDQAGAELLESFRFKREQMTLPVDYEAIRRKQREELLDYLVEKITTEIKASAVHSKAT